MTWKLSSSHSAAGGSASSRRVAGQRGVDLPQRPHVVGQLTQVRPAAAAPARRNREQRRQPPGMLFQQFDAEKLFFLADRPRNPERTQHPLNPPVRASSGDPPSVSPGAARRCALLHTGSFHRLSGWPGRQPDAGSRFAAEIHHAADRWPRRAADRGGSPPAVVDGGQGHAKPARSMSEQWLAEHRAAHPS